jgi:hypothetical protein
MGKLATPSLIAQSIAPSVGAFLMTSFGANTTLEVLVRVAMVNVALVILLSLHAHRSGSLAIKV